MADILANWQFWAAAAVMVLGIAALFLQALRRAPLPSDEGEDLQVYRDQLAEVDRDLARGTLPASEAERLRLEVSRRLLDADRALQSARAQSSPLGNARMAAVFVLGCLVLAVWLYTRLGVPAYPDVPISERLAFAEETYKTRPSQAVAEAQTPPTAATNVDPAFLDLIGKLRAAVASHPDDQQGLQLLARNEATLGNYAAAAKAQAHLIALKGTAADAVDHADLAQMLIAAAGGYVSPEAEAELVRALQIDPANKLSRYYSGLMFAQVGRPDRAFALWAPLLDEGPQDAPWIKPIRSKIEDIAAQAGVNYTLADEKGPDAAAMAAAGQMSAADRQEMIKGMVGQLETRLMSEGGPPEEWAKLITSLGVLGEQDRAGPVLEAARKAYAGQDSALAKIKAAAQQAGLEQ